MEPSDEALILACRSGDPVAWETLIARYQRLVFSIPRRAGLDTDLWPKCFSKYSPSSWSGSTRLSSQCILALGWRPPLGVKRGASVGVNVTARIHAGTGRASPRGYP